MSLAVATPKQIRDIMQVDGLTNDEVKSHLQVYIHLCSFNKYEASCFVPMTLVLEINMSNGRANN